MRKLLVISSLILLAACARKSFPDTLMNKATETNRVYIEYRDTLVRIAANGILVNKNLPGDCPDFDTTVKKGKQTVNVKKQGNNLSVECKQDSLELVIKGLLERRFETKTVEIEKPVKVPDPYPYIPKWIWYVLATSLGGNLWSYRKVIIALFKKLILGF